MKLPLPLMETNCKTYAHLLRACMPRLYAQYLHQSYYENDP